MAVNKDLNKNADKKMKIKFIPGYYKEMKWLEEMASKGWFLSNITFGFIYSFSKGQPRRMIYDVDRFNLSAKPSLEEIRRKEMFMEMAQEMGWKEVTHDEGLTYYFCREYEEGSINYLHNDDESRRYRAECFKAYFMEQMKKYVFWVMVIGMCDVLIKLMQLYTNQSFYDWFHWFASVYVMFCSAMALYCWHKGRRQGKEFSMTRDEWEQRSSPDTHKCVRKLLWTNRGLSRFLSRQAEQGWILTSLTPTRYYFEKGRGEKQIYTMDSKWLVNKRRESFGEKKIEDGKDWCGLNNDWEIQSLHDAEEKGWSFVCALENRGIIYRGGEGSAALNDSKYDNSLRWISLIGEYSFYLLLGGLAGGIIGFILGMYNI